MPQLKNIMPPRMKKTPRKNQPFLFKGMLLNTFEYIDENKERKPRKNPHNPIAPKICKGL